MYTPKGYKRVLLFVAREELKEEVEGLAPEEQVYEQALSDHADFNYRHI
jgi:hypothetical protein